ncbi:hypothetical protein ZIOFF_024831 [Zingiber officinale]|uniref:Uncharacterized protein n=1 Tax=Zingiber officinale TaxID=94328 RepID=A0A8J5LDT3_ZINOF|nr:hypothetical protein ZIOFF_024831 [Zingiber officinale]
MGKAIAYADKENSFATVWRLVLTWRHAISADVLGAGDQERLPTSSPEVPLWLRRTGVKGNALVPPWCSLAGKRACFDRVLPTADSSDDQQILEASGDISVDGAEGILDSVTRCCGLMDFSFRSGVGPDMTYEDLCAIATELVIKLSQQPKLVEEEANKSAKILNKKLERVEQLPHKIGKLIA